MGNGFSTYPRLTEASTNERARLTILALRLTSKSKRIAYCEAANLNRHFQQIGRGGPYDGNRIPGEPGAPDFPELFNITEYGRSYGAKHFPFSAISKNEYRRRRKFARGVDIAPADAIFDGVFFDARSNGF